MDASRIEFPTRSTMHPRMSGSTLLISSTFCPVCCPIRVPRPFPLPLSMALAVAGQRGEVELSERLLHEPALIGVVEHLPGHLLGREHGQVGDLVADLLDRAPRLGLDVPAGLLEHLLALMPGGLDRLAFVLFRGL